ncbi:bacterial transcriptional activator domain-containing protein [Streptomyces sp. NPDC005480]|uniref:bacterial transcriptional activator domain-containing protein n=1 Tax=Streptomyces sp. NPDC005480 TaxID=3154880 RepID=UPI0033B7EC17
MSKTSPYALSDKVRCDWNEFERLAKLGVSRGDGGLPYLERALTLAGGVPLGEHAASWMEPLRTYMQDQIADVAHTVATYRTLKGPHQDFPSARQACAIGLSADSLSETLHRAMMKIEAEAGNRTGLRTAVAHWQDATRHLSEVDAKTQALVDKLLSA